MDTRTTFATFDDYRDRMLGILTAAEPAIAAASEPPADTSALNVARTRMSRLLTAYHLFAQRELFSPCAALGDPARRSFVRAVEADCALLARDFRAFARECEARPVEGWWMAYRPKAREMMARIRSHLRAAETEIRYCERMGAGRTAARAA